MMAFGVVITCIVVVLPSALSAGGPCDKLGNTNWGSLGSRKACRMRTTVIDSADFLITSERDEAVEVFSAWNHTNLEHFPKNLGEKFPNLIVLGARNCSIKKITKQSFKGLSKLRQLSLWNNQIEKIDDDTFEYIPAVEKISLDRNKIKKLNGLAFASLNQLTSIYLNHNVCINEKFIGATGIIEMPLVVTSKCGFEPNGGPCETIIIQSFGAAFGSRKTCRMRTTVIDSADFLITSARDETIDGFNSVGNRKLDYLPKNIGEKFPNLIVLGARNCSIKEITKENFKRLNKLRILMLEGNQIVKIDDDTFEYMPAVEQIHMKNNNISKLNGHAFASLSMLWFADFRMNYCIDEYFSEGIAEMRRIITTKCGFDNKKNDKKSLCGVSKKATPTIVRGENFVHGDFPWMVALHRRLTNRKQYFCGGSVISDSHVLTAAHCLEGLVASDIFAVLGAYDLNDLLEVGRVVRSPSKIFVHDHWNPRVTKIDGDIAMLLMTEKIIFSSFVQPICLWESQTAPPVSTGIVLGWGQSQNTSKNHESIPTMLELPIHTNEDCFLTHPELAQVSSNRTLCAGSADGRGPCHGDSGGGFYVHVENVLYLRGIVSAAWDVDIYGQCLLKLYSIYTDAVKYAAWIDETMARK